MVLYYSVQISGLRSCIYFCIYDYLRRSHAPRSQIRAIQSFPHLLARRMPGSHFSLELLVKVDSREGTETLAVPPARPRASEHEV